MQLKKLMWILVAILLITPMVFGEDIVFKKGETMDLKVNCFDTASNICEGACQMSILYPNGSSFQSLQKMSLNGAFYNYTLPTIDVVGQYKVVVNCSDSLTAGYTNFDFFINSRGDKPDTPQSIIYFVLISLTGLLLVLSVYGTFNSRNKYISMLLFGFSYLLCILLTSTIHSVADAYLNGGFVLSVIKVFFYVLVIGAFPLLIYILAMIIYNVVTDKQIQDLVKRGLR